MPHEAARGEACKNSMFPGTGVDVLAGHRRRCIRLTSERRAANSASRCRRFHDRVLSVRIDPGAAHRDGSWRVIRAGWTAAAVADHSAGGRLRAARRPVGRGAAVQRSADRRLRPRARYAQPLQHPHPRGHPDLRGRRTDDDRRADAGGAAARLRGADASRTAASCSAPTAAWTSSWQLAAERRRGTMASRSRRPTSSSRSTRSTARTTTRRARTASIASASVDTPDPLTAVVHYKEIYAPYDIQFIRGTLPETSARGPRHRSRAGLQPQSARHRAVSRRRVESRRVHPARARAALLARRRVSADSGG